MNNDPLSDLLALLSVQSVIAGGFVIGGDWSVRFPPPDLVKFFIAARGACWLCVDGEAPVRFNEGDVFLLAAPRAFTVTSDPALPPQDAVELFTDSGRPIIQVGQGQDFFFLGGHVTWDSTSGRLLTSQLPATIHLRVGSAEANALQWLVNQIVQEHGTGRTGSGFAVAQLAQLVFLHILRGYVATATGMMAGRLRAISEPRIAPAIRMMHDAPGRAWHLNELASACAMSRTAFAACFKSVAGVAPLAYLTEWRMHLAERALRESKVPLATLSESLGYSSESAFSTAFKRVTGNAPQRYRAMWRQQNINAVAGSPALSDH